MPGQQVINLTGISDGIGDLGQTVTVTAISSNPGLINPTVTITHPTGSTDSIIYTPTANTTGTATISVIVTDNGGTSNGGINTFIGTFTVVVTGINAPPTINAIPSLPGVLENSGPQTINLFGISAGPGDVGETVTITATSSNPTLIPNPSITYTNPNTTGTLTFTPVAFGTGTATITVTLVNNGGTANGGHEHDHHQLQRDGHPGQPAAHARRDPQPRGDPREYLRGADRQPHGHHRRNRPTRDRP